MSGMPHFQGVGVAFKPRHFEALMACPRELSWLEVHAENYMGAGGPMHDQLRQLSAHYPISLHGVGLSLGGAQAPDPAHLKRLKQLIDWIAPVQFSEHLAWSSHDGFYTHDLLPVSYHSASLARIAKHIDITQQALGAQILIENPASYLSFDDCVMRETDFLAALVAQTGCGLLLDLNNVYVSALNQNTRAEDYLAAFPYAAVGEIHLAGFTRDTDGLGHEVLIDTHGAPVDAAVWHLYADVIARHGAFPTLIERDTHVPHWSVLEQEVRQAAKLLGRMQKTKNRPQPLGAQSDTVRVGR